MVGSSRGFSNTEELADDENKGDDDKRWKLEAHDPSEWLVCPSLNFTATNI